MKILPMIRGPVREVGSLGRVEKYIVLSRVLALSLSGYVVYSAKSATQVGVGSVIYARFHRLSFIF
jgi:hypothetical protein